MDGFAKRNRLSGESGLEAAGCLGDRVVRAVERILGGRAPRGDVLGVGHSGELSGRGVGVLDPEDGERELGLDVVELHTGDRVIVGGLGPEVVEGDLGGLGGCLGLGDGVGGHGHGVRLRMRASTLRRWTAMVRGVSGRATSFPSATYLRTVRGATDSRSAAVLVGTHS